MRQKLLVKTTVLALALAVITSACVDGRREAATPVEPSSSPSSPTPSPSGQVSGVLSIGAWSSATQISSPSFAREVCGNFQWAISSLTTTSAAGTFKAVCGDGLTLQGTAEGTLSDNTAKITANGTASSAAVSSCTFTLSAVAVPQGLDSVRLTYTGNVCGMTVSGSDVLKKT